MREITKNHNGFRVYISKILPFTTLIDLSQADENL